MAQLARNYRGYLRLEDECEVTTWDNSWREYVKCAMGSRGWESARAGVEGGGRVV